MKGNDWSELIVQLQKKEEEIPEEGFFTRSQYEKKWNVKSCETQSRLNRLLEAGLAETKKFRVQTGTRGLYPTPHYRIK